MIYEIEATKAKQYLNPINLTWWMFQKEGVILELGSVPDKLRHLKVDKRCIASLEKGVPQPTFSSAPKTFLSPRLLIGV